MDILFKDFLSVVRRMRVFDEFRYSYNVSKE